MPKSAKPRKPMSAAKKAKVAPIKTQPVDAAAYHAGRVRAAFEEAERTTAATKDGTALGAATQVGLNMVGYYLTYADNMSRERALELMGEAYDRAVTAKAEKAVAQ